MKLETEGNKNMEHSNDGIPHPRTLWQAFLLTFLPVCFLTLAIAEENSQPPLVSYAFDDESNHLVVASCFEGLGYLLVFDVNANSYPINPKTQSPLEEACDDGLMLFICPQSYPLSIYSKNAQTRLNRVYRAN